MSEISLTGSMPDKVVQQTVIILDVVHLPFAAFLRRLLLVQSLLHDRLDERVDHAHGPRRRALEDLEPRPDPPGARPLGDRALCLQKRACKVVRGGAGEVVICGWRVVRVRERAVAQAVDTAAEEELRGRVQGEPRNRILEVDGVALVRPLFYFVDDVLCSGGKSAVCRSGTTTLLTCMTVEYFVVVDPIPGKERAGHRPVESSSIYLVGNSARLCPGSTYFQRSPSALKTPVPRTDRMNPSNRSPGTQYASSITELKYGFKPRTFDPVFEVRGEYALRLDCQQTQTRESGAERYLNDVDIGRAIIVVPHDIKVVRRA